MLHLRQNCPRHVDGTKVVRLHHPVHLRLGGVLESGGHGGAGAVHQEVDRAEVAAHAGQGSADLDVGASIENHVS